MSRQIISSEVRLSFPFLLQPRPADARSEAKYEVTMMIPKTDAAMINEIQAGMNEAYQEGISGEWRGAQPNKMNDVIKDGDATDLSKYPMNAGHWLLKAKSGERFPPQVVNQYGQMIIDQNEVYGGMYGRVSFHFAPYDFSGAKGITCYLGNVMKSRDGERFGGESRDAKSQFAQFFQQAPSLGIQQGGFVQPQPAVNAPIQGQYAVQNPVPQQGGFVPVQQPVQQQSVQQPAGFVPQQPVIQQPVTPQPQQATQYNGVWGSDGAAEQFGNVPDLPF